MKDLVIRTARDEDRDAIREVTLAAYQQYEPVIPELWAGYRQNLVDTLADPRPAEQIVAELGGEIVGAVLVPLMFAHAVVDVRVYFHETSRQAA
jgi:predicted N-acetyltransferase YhbS